MAHIISKTVDVIRGTVRGIRMLTAAVDVLFVVCDGTVTVSVDGMLLVILGGTE